MLLPSSSLFINSNIMNLTRTFLNLAAIASAAAASSTFSTIKWTANSLEKACPNIETTRICNPDSILSETISDDEGGGSGQDDVTSISTALRELESNHPLRCNNDSTSTDVQMAIAIVNSIDMHGKNHFSDDFKIQEAKKIAMNIHDSWGVGNTECNGSGIVLLMSVKDRVAYISTSSGLSPILTKGRIDHIIEEMKSLLKDQEYAKATVNAIHFIIQYIDKGPPSFWEQYWGLLFMGAIFGGVIGSSKWQQKKKTEYVKVKSHLDKIDRDKALVLMGKYECSSCPICLEDFKCPHLESGKKRESPPTSPVSSPDHDSNAGIPYIGSDGKPLQLLRCGHAFDKSCWEEWTSSPSCNIYQCPICKQDIGASASVDPDQRSSYQGRQEFRPLNRLYNNMGWPSARQQQQQQMYQFERNFRIHRLHHQYPHYIRQSNVDRWTCDSYDGTMAQDSDFLHRDPVVHDQQHSSGILGSGGASGSSFGGGHSGGGSGGTW